MKNNKEKRFITEISEEDFRKLNLEGRVAAEFDIISKKTIALNDVLDACINHLKECTPELLSIPITIAIFNNDVPCERSFSIVTGLKHAYSTRDYFIASGGVWKVKKRHLKAIYRIHLDK